MPPSQAHSRQTLEHLTVPTRADAHAGGHSAAHPFAHSRALPPSAGPFKRSRASTLESHLHKGPCARVHAHRHSALHTQTLAYSILKSRAHSGLGVWERKERWNLGERNGGGPDIGAGDAAGGGGDPGAHLLQESWEGELAKSTELPHTTAPPPPPPQERISLEAWLREGDRTTSSGFPKEGRGPGWRGLESRSRLLVARRGLSRLARKRGRSQRVREGVGVVGKSILAVPTLPRRAAGARGPTD